jgi:hypothetical protein
MNVRLSADAWYFVQLFYRLNHARQTFEFVARMKHKHLVARPLQVKMSVFDALHCLGDLQVRLDPLVDCPSVFFLKSFDPSLCCPSVLPWSLWQSSHTQAGELC